MRAPLAERERQRPTDAEEALHRRHGEDVERVGAGDADQCHRHHVAERLHAGEGAQDARDDHRHADDGVGDGQREDVEADGGGEVVRVDDDDEHVTRHAEARHHEDRPPEDLTRLRLRQRRRRRRRAVHVVGQRVVPRRAVQHAGVEADERQHRGPPRCSLDGRGPRSRRAVRPHGARRRPTCRSEYSNARTRTAVTPATSDAPSVWSSCELTRDEMSAGGRATERPRYPHHRAAAVAAAAASVDVARSIDHAASQIGRNVRPRAENTAFRK